MAREETMAAPHGPAPVTLVTVAALFGRLVGLALALGIAVGLLLTAAAVALPAPAVGQELTPDRRSQADRRPETDQILREAGRPASLR